MKSVFIFLYCRDKNPTALCYFLAVQLPVAASHLAIPSWVCVSAFRPYWSVFKGPNCSQYTNQNEQQSMMFVYEIFLFLIIDRLGTSFRDPAQMHASNPTLQSFLIMQEF
jgi:hypothetical protein